MNKTVGVNVAPSSTNGHYIKNLTEGKPAPRVIELSNETESFFVEGKSVLKTENHTTIKHSQSVLILTQSVYDPVSQLMRKAVD